MTIVKKYDREMNPKKTEIAKKMKGGYKGTGTPKAKWGAKQGNFMKVHPLDRK